MVSIPSSPITHLTTQGTRQGTVIAAIRIMTLVLITRTIIIAMIIIIVTAITVVVVVIIVVVIVVVGAGVAAAETTQGRLRVLSGQPSKKKCLNPLNPKTPQP